MTTLWVLTQDLEISKVTSIFSFTFLKMATDQVSLGGRRSLLMCLFFSHTLGSPCQLFQLPTKTWGGAPAFGTRTGGSCQAQSANSQCGTAEQGQQHSHTATNAAATVEKSGHGSRYKLTETFNENLLLKDNFIAPMP